MVSTLRPPRRGQGEKMPTALDDFDASSFDPEPDASDDSAAVAATATEGPPVQICNPWDSMLRWYDCLVIEPSAANPSGESLPGSVAANDLVFSAPN
jgi:hypothetical protein